MPSNKKWIHGYKGRYFATWDGKIVRVYESGKTRQLKGYKKGNLYCVKLTNHHGITKEYTFQRIIWETFKGPIPPGYLVTRKIAVLTENGMHNLRLRTKQQHGKKTGALARSKQVELLNEKGEIIDSWSSARKAAKELYFSYQTIMDYCNQKVKKPLVNVRWARGESL